MSLFPSYASANCSEEASQFHEEEWLQNSSFAIDVKKFGESSQYEQSSASCVSLPQTKFKRNSPSKRKSKHKRQRVDNNEKDLANDNKTTDQSFRIDIKGNRQLSIDKTISRPPNFTYKVAYRLYDKPKRAPKKIKRYFQFKYEKVTDNLNAEENVLTKKQLSEPIKVDRDQNFTGFKQEEEMSQMTATFNRGLMDNPKDVELWIKYVQFQDKVFQFEKSYRKGSIAKGQRVTAERKIAILDKALGHNPDNEALMRERLNVCVAVYPADEVESQLKKLVEKDTSNIIWWQGYIEASQCSMSRCNTPAVLKLYSKCLSTLHQLRRNSVLEKAHLEENIMRMLYQCSLFLKQSGLFEQLWTLLRLYLELNLSPSDKNKFNIPSGFDEKELVELEEVVLNSKLPIHELWLRVERLREACHWLPYADTENCEDPQRLVFPEDVAELIHPITMPGNTFKLTAIILTLLKTPLLPCRHTTMQVLGLDYVPWALDSVETLLPIFFSIYPVDTVNRHLLKNTHQFVMGPQYLKALPGQEEYLIFLLSTIKNCADCLKDKEKLAVTIWWFRFQRLLFSLETEGRIKITQNLKKKMKANMKQVLKAEGNNGILYQEYALIEYELGNSESALNVLITTIKMYDGKILLNINNPSLRTEICSMYRSLIEMYLRVSNDIENNKQSALKYLVSLSTGKRLEEIVLNSDLLEEAKLKFKHIVLQVLKDFPNPSIVLVSEDHFLPNYFTDIIICYGWFLYLTKGVIECGSFLQETLNEMEDSGWCTEIIYEFYVTILFKNCLEQKGLGLFRILDEVLYKAIEIFPNNIYLLSVLAKEHSLNCSLGQSLWKISKILIKTGHSIPSLFLILISNQKVCEIEENWTDTITGKCLTMEDSYKNCILSFFRKLTSAEMCTRRCGLTWRLYLQFLHSHFDSGVLRKAYYLAVEECPWLKALYIDAAIYIPAELPQIQDLIVEKQLRIHVTPEELDILRN